MLDRGGGPLLVGGERLGQIVDRAGGGGPKFDPYTLAEARDWLTPQAEQLRAQFAQLPEALRGERLYFQATLFPNYIADSWFPGPLLTAIGAMPVGTRVSQARYLTQTIDEIRPTKSLILSASAESADRLVALIANEPATRTAQAGRELLIRVADVRIPALAETIRPDSLAAGAELWEAVLNPESVEFGHYRPVSEATFIKWQRWIASLGGVVEEGYRREVEGLTFVPVRLAAARAAEAARFNPLRTMRPMPAVRPLPTFALRGVGGAAPPPPQQDPPPDVIRIAVFDGGVNVTDPRFTRYVREFDLTGLPVDPDAYEHGNMVTSLLLFGAIRRGQQLRAPGAHVDHYRILPVPAGEFDWDLYWILDRILEAVGATDYPLVSLSIGPDLPIDDNEPHRWTAELDRLAYEKTVLFVSAVGNNGDRDAALGLNRIEAPGDMVNGLGVGACDTLSPAAFSRAPYSAIGPGRVGCRLQPAGVSFGGIETNQAIGIGSTGGLVASFGTSFAAPLATNGLVNLRNLLGDPHASPNSARAIAIHFSEPSATPSPTELGRGRFRERYGPALLCEAHEVSVLYEGEIQRAATLSLLLPFPSEISTGMVDLSWTLVAATPVDPADAFEYTRYGLDLVLRPNSNLYSFTDPITQRSGKINVQTDPRGAQALFARGINLSDNPSTRSISLLRTTEAQRREDGKWETVRHGVDRMRASSLHEPRFDISFLARSGGALTAAGVAPVRFSLIATIRMRPGTQLYTRIRASYDVLTPVTTEVRLTA